MPKTTTTILRFPRSRPTRNKETKMQRLSLAYCDLGIVGDQSVSVRFFAGLAHQPPKVYEYSEERKGRSRLGAF